MPFDVLSNRPYTLTDHLQSVGVRPLPMEQLKAHKAEQIRLHPPSILGTPMFYKALFGVSVIGTLWLEHAWELTGMSLMIAVGSILLVSAVNVFIAFWLVMFSCSMFSIPIKGRARWLETWFMSLSGRSLPEPIRAVAARIKHEWPSENEPPTFSIGKLVQSNIDLDPYLLVKFNGETACLGIWDYDERGKPKIIAVAEMI